MMTRFHESKPVVLHNKTEHIRSSLYNIPSIHYTSLHKHNEVTNTSTECERRIHSRIYTH